MTLFIKQSKNSKASTVNDIIHLVESLKTRYQSNILENYGKISFTQLFQEANGLNIDKLVEFLVEEQSTLELTKQSLNENTELNSILETTKTQEYLSELTDLAYKYKALSEGIIPGPLKDLYNYAERKLKGYSVGQVDRLIERSIKIKSESDKRDIIEDIENAIKEASEERVKVDREYKNAKTLHKNEEATKLGNKLEALDNQLDVLRKLKPKVQSIDVTDRLDSEKSLQGKSYRELDDEEKRRINLDERYELNFAKEILLAEERVNGMKLYSYLTGMDTALALAESFSMDHTDPAYTTYNGKFEGQYEFDSIRSFRNFQLQVDNRIKLIKTKEQQQQALSEIDSEINYIHSLMHSSKANQSKDWSKPLTHAATGALVGGFFGGSSGFDDGLLLGAGFGLARTLLDKKPGQSKAYKDRLEKLLRYLLQVRSKVSALHVR